MADYNSSYTGLQIDTAISYLDQTVKSGDSPTFVGTNLTGIPNGALTTNPLARVNHTGTQTVSTISDFDAEVSNNSSVSANTTHKTSDGSDHTFIDQSVISGATPTLTGTNFTGIPNGGLSTNPLARANHTGTQLANTISDFDTQVKTNLYYVTPEDFGAIGDGVTDDADAINLALVAATNSTLRLGENKTYLCKDYIILPDVTIKGEGKTSIIRFDNTFVPDLSGADPASSSDPRDRAGIYNVNFGQYNDSTANSIVFEDFRIETDNLDMNFMLSVANIKSFIVTNMEFEIYARDVGVSPSRDFFSGLDFRKAWRNVAIRDSKFFQYNGNDTGTSGDCIEFTNWTTDGDQTVNDCDTAIVENCTFEKNVSDEWIWVDSASGVINNVSILNSSFKQYTTGVTSAGGSGLALVRGKAIYPHSLLNNVLVDNNNFYSQQIVTANIQVGRSTDVSNTTTKVSNAKITNNKLFIVETATGGGAETGITFYSENQGENNVAINNTIETASTIVNPAYAGIQGGDKVERNYISGTFTYGLLTCDKCCDNSVNVIGGKAMQNCNNLLRDYLQGDIASVYRTTQDFYATLCEFVTDTGSNVVEAQSNVPNVTFDKCIFSGASASRPVYSTLAPTSTFTFLDCTNETSGSSMLVGTNADEKILKMRGNKLDANGYDDYYSFSDDPANLDVFFRLTAPISHIIYDKVAFTSWQKQASGSSSDNWSKVFISGRSITPIYSATPSVNVTNIQSALDLAESSGDYNIVYLPISPDGIVEVDSPIYIPRKITFLGTGKGSILKASSTFTGDGIIQYKTYATYTTTAEQFVVQDMTIDGNLDSQKVLCTFTNGTDKVNSVAHGLVNTDKIRFSDTENIDRTQSPSADGVLPAEISKYLTYYVINKTDDTFEVSRTSGGAAVDFTDDGSLLLYYFPLTRNGIYLTADGDAKYENVGDNFSTFKDLFIRNCSKNGIMIPEETGTPPQRAIAMYFDRITIRDCGVAGIWTYGSDSFYSNINCVACGYGYYIRGGNNSFVNIKSFYSEITGLHFGDGSVGCKASNVECQEDLDIGVRFLSTVNVTVTNLVSEAHGHDGDGVQVASANAGEGVGIEMSTASDCFVQGVVNNRTALAGWIKWATRFYGTNTNNKIDIRMPDMGRIIPFEYEAIPSNGVANEVFVDGSDVFATQSVIYDPPSLADGEGVTTTVTVAGATLGQMANASFSLSPQGILITADVTATNTVSVRFQNETGGVIDLLSGTLRVKVIRI